MSTFHPDLHTFAHVFQIKSNFIRHWRYNCQLHIHSAPFNTQILLATHHGREDTSPWIGPSLHTSNLTILPPAPLHVLPTAPSLHAMYASHPNFPFLARHSTLTALAEKGALCRPPNAQGWKKTTTTIENKDGVLEGASRAQAVVWNQRQQDNVIDELFRFRLGQQVIKYICGCQPLKPV